MRLKAKKYFAVLLAHSLMAVTTASLAADTTDTDYERARWDPIHFKPAIDNATNEQCLECHEEVLKRTVRQYSPAGLKTTKTLAWYQTLTSYEGDQETFHRRHLVTPMAKELMDMQCNTCHQGHDPREEAQNPPDHNNQDFTLRKAVNPTICLMCHGADPYKPMGLPGPWRESRELFLNDCMLCHFAVRTNRHQVNYLKADAIEMAGKKDSDTCHGCHGGRQWYRTSYPYPRHAWKGMGDSTPDWAKDRPTESEPRFRIK